MILSEQQYDEIVYQEQRNVEHWYTTANYDEFQSRRLKLDQNSLFRYEFASSLYLFSPGDDDGHYCICDCRAEGGGGEEDSCRGADSYGSCRRELVSRVLQIQGLANSVLSDCPASWLLLFDLNGSDFDYSSPEPVVGVGQASFRNGLKKQLSLSGGLRRKRGGCAVLFRSALAFASVPYEVSLEDVSISSFNGR